VIRTLKAFGKRVLQTLGADVHAAHAPGSPLRRVGMTRSVLEDMRARGFAPRLIFDVGASNGSWSQMTSAVFPDARIVMVDPRPAAAPALTAFCRTSEKFEAELVAVGAQAGSATMTDWDTGSTLLPVDATGSPQLTVPVVTLDALAAKWGAPDLIKMDIEGFELQALQGASTVLGVTDVFIIEVALFRFVDRPMLHDVVAFMERHDYVVYDICDPIRRPFDGALGLLDVCFARRSSALRSSETAWHA
jgi:FkbM family methyltransferase